MAGIYLHIPFCKKACNYCNFHFTTSLRHKDDLIKAMILEAEAEKDYLGGETVHSIYFGGGTPSILNSGELEMILEAIFKIFKVAEDAEITLEANPDDIDDIKVNEWKKLGFNRLSLGVQSFFDEELLWMNRAHNSKQALLSIQLVKEAGFMNFNIDLIYGSPLLENGMWQKNLDIAISLGIPHISCYALTVEEKTPLARQIGMKQKKPVDPDRQANQFLMVMECLKESGYEHYEISNFALQGFRSRHNSAYWKGEKYLGIGASAHSFNVVERRWNVADNQQYINGIFCNSPVRETEILSSLQKLNEYIMISLRKSEGMDLNFIERQWGNNEKNQIENELRNFIHSALVVKEGNVIRLTEEGKLLADGISAALFKL